MENISKTLYDFLPSEPKKLKDRLSEWGEFFDLTTKYKTLSLGNGAPNWLPPKFLREEMMNAVDSCKN